MKKIILSVVIGVGFLGGVQAQTMKVTSAFNYNKQGDYDKAKEAIDDAVVHEKTANDPKSHLFRGEIYYNLAISTDERFAGLKTGAADISKESLEKAYELVDNNKRVSKRDIDDWYGKLITLYYNQAIAAYDAKDFNSASVNFEKAAEVRGTLLAGKPNALDTLAYYNAGATAQQAEDFTRALEMYSKVKHTGYDSSNLFYRMASIQLQMDNTDGAMQTIQEGKELFPGDKNLLLLETNLYLKDPSKREQAIANLTEAIAGDPTNATLLFARGTLYDQAGKADLAKADYIKAVEVDPNNFDANYNLGAMYVNASGEIQEKMNNLNINEQKKYDELKKERDALFNQAIGPLEKALSIEPDNKTVMKTLMELYGKTGQSEKYTEMKAKVLGE